MLNTKDTVVNAWAKVVGDFVNNGGGLHSSDEELFAGVVVPFVDAAIACGRYDVNKRDQTLAGLRQEISGIRAWFVRGALSAVLSGKSRVELTEDLHKHFGRGAT